MSLDLIKKNLFTPILTLILFNSYISVANAQKKIDYNYKTSNQEVIKINNSASNTLYETISGKVRESVLISAKKDLRHAILLDPDYKRSYLNLLDCIKSMNEKPYSVKTGFLKEQIDICNLWLARHQDDQDMRIKRGILHEKNKEIVLSNQDYEIVKNYLGKLNIKCISGMSEQAIQDNSGYSLLFFIVRERERGLKLISDFKRIYPDNAHVNSIYKIIADNNREEYIFESTTRTISH
ncbi:hypothetical protein [Pedobacter sp. UYP1]|uniref:hypothetical protein n=1 Tax=Pedobacter sp. UYP1 TaxID=1756396 RepID=UPI00339160CA